MAITSRNINLPQNPTERLPSKTALVRVDKLATRVERNALEAREFNKTVSPQHQENFYLAGMNLIAETFYKLARNEKSNPETVRMYAQMLLEHFKQRDKERKTAVMMGHLELLQKKQKALEDACKDRGLTDQQFFGKIRDIFVMEKPAKNGHRNETPLLQDSLAS